MQFESVATYSGALSRAQLKAMHNAAVPKSGCIGCFVYNAVMLPCRMNLKSP